MKKILVLGDKETAQFHHLQELQPLIEELKMYYEVTETDEYGSITITELKKYDVILNYIDNWKARGSRQSEEAIMSYMNEGGGMLVLHCGIITKSAKDMTDLFGGAFDGHAEYQPLTYESVDTVHPITKEIPSFSMPEEPYRFVMHSTQDTKVILTYTMEGKLFPAGWIRQAGKGNMVYLLFGHNRQSFEQPEARCICGRAVDWLIEQQ